MKGLLIFTLGTFLAMQAPSPERPFPNHEKPPDGWSCHPALDQKEVQTNPHACACRGMTMVDPEPKPEHCAKSPTYDDEGNQNGEVLIERSTCKSYCWKSSCTCAKRCGTT